VLIQLLLQAFALHRENMKSANLDSEQSEPASRPLPEIEIKEEKPMVDAAAAAAALSTMDCDTTDAEVFLTKWVASIRPAVSASSSAIVGQQGWSTPSSSEDSSDSCLDIIEQDEGFQWGAESESHEASSSGDATAALRWHLRWSEEETAPEESMSCGAALSLFLEQQQQQVSGGRDLGFF